MGAKASGTQWVVPTEPMGTKILGTVVDVSLWVAVYYSALAFSPSRGSAGFNAQIAADRFLSQWNFKTIQRAMLHARRKKLLKPILRRRSAFPEITEAGRRRLAEILPAYDQHRVWDGRMHLITYDVPETQHEDRDALRTFIRTIGAGRLQDSVWITPYNPIDTIRSFIIDHNLGGTVIVSDMGKDGALGEEDIHSLVIRIWRLDKLNERYEEWLAEAKQSKRADGWMTVSYLSILKDDPQLPFALLPPWWKGDDAYRLVRPNISKLQMESRP